MQIVMRRLFAHRISASVTLATMVLELTVQFVMRALGRRAEEPLHTVPVRSAKEGHGHP
jgi:hypothetical protein